MASQHRVTASSFEAICDGVARLQPAEKIRLWQLLEAEIGLAEEAALERSPAIESEIREARAAYDDGDYVTLEEYMADCGDRKE